MQRILKSAVSIALIVLSIYVTTTHNLAYYTAMIAVAVILGSWLSTKTKNAAWTIPALVAVGVAWMFRWLGADSAMVAFAIIPGLVGLQSLTGTVLGYAPRKPAAAAAPTPSPFAGFQKVYGAEGEVPAHIRRETAPQAPVTPGPVPYTPPPAGDYASPAPGL